MGKLSIEDIKEGMILEADVLKDGQVLLKEGVELTERHINICRSWGIQSMDIKDLDAEQVGQDFFANIDPKVMWEAELEADQNCCFFQKEIPLHERLYEIHLRRLLERRLHAQA